MRWQLQDAKNQLSKLVQLARQRGPQIITRHGKPEAVVISMQAYDKLTRRQGSLVDFLRNSPLAAAGIETVRDRSAGRDVVL